MGRKIPGKKHRGVKDPVVQQEKKLADLKKKINAPPTNPNEQEVPKSLQRIIDLTRKVKDGTISLKRKKKKNKKKNSLITIGSEHLKKNYGIGKKSKPEKSLPILKQRLGEKDHVFLNRVNNMVKNVILENQFEQKFGVDVLRNPETGEVEDVVKKEKDPVDEMLKQIKKEKSDKRKKKKSKNDSVQLNRTEKRKLKRQKCKKKQKESKIDEFNEYKDEVKFGEVVHAPPSLKVPKKFTKSEALKPGQKDLLLKEMLQKNTEKRPPPIKKTVNSINKKGKRKDLPAATRRMLESHRDEVVKAYKLLKNANK